MYAAQPLTPLALRLSAHANGVSELHGEVAREILFLLRHRGLRLRLVRRATAIAGTLGVSAPVVVVTRDEIEQILAASPYPDEPDPAN